MSSSENFSFVRRVSQIGTLLQTFLRGKEVGCDSFGNRYYRERGTPRPSNGGRVRQKRWVIYAGEPEPTKVPPEWHLWLHHTADAPLIETGHRAWQKPHSANKTGTTDAWMPPTLKDESRPQTSGDYQAWKQE